jgi:glycosyltransferase involved in cell wall biosynthesis
MSSSLVSIILPVHNDAAYLNEVVAEYESVLTRLSTLHELILVPNGCRDQSPAICRQLSEKHSSVRVVESERGSWGLAVKQGLAVARGDLLCYTNLARTGPADLLLLLLYAVAYPNVVVKANRKIRESVIRRLGSLIYNLECRALFDLSYWDINGTPKIFPRTFVRLLALKREDDLIDAEFNLICREENYPVIEVPILSYRRHGGKSTTNYQSALKLYWGAYQMSRDRRKQTA